jgi:hypothetical protein
VAGLVPAIHAVPLQATFKVGDFRSAWMPGTSPGKTREGCGRKAGHAVRGLQKA